MQGKMRCVASLFDPFLATIPFQYSLKSIGFLIFPGSVEKVCWREINSITTSYEIKILKKVKTDWVFQTWLLEKFHGINTIIEKLLLTKNIAIQICILLHWILIKSTFGLLLRQKPLLFIWKPEFKTSLSLTDENPHILGQKVIVSWF